MECPLYTIPCGVMWFVWIPRFIPKPSLSTFGRGFYRGWFFMIFIQASQHVFSLHPFVKVPGKDPEGTMLGILGVALRALLGRVMQRKGTAASSRCGSIIAPDQRSVPTSDPRRFQIKPQVIRPIQTSGSRRETIHTGQRQREHNAVGVLCLLGRVRHVLVV